MNKEENDNYLILIQKLQDSRYKTMLLIFSYILYWVATQKYGDNFKITTVSIRETTKNKTNNNVCKDKIEYIKENLRP